MNKDLEQLPDDLPQPRDDKKFDHLVGVTIPSITLKSTEGATDVSKIDAGYVVLYFFPMMSVPEKTLPSGWNDIPGARGCTPQNITINEHIEDLQKYGVMVCGISTQSIDELTELSSLRKLSQLLISDSSLKFQENLQIPTFHVDNKTMYKRLTLIVKNCKIVRVFYPIFPPDKHIFEILEWFETNSKG
ncbi:redoxin family protein [archaeon]|nr:redoxin family protein [archaeon]